MLDKSIKQYLTDLSSDSPTPGGGFAAGLMAAQGASLILMAAELSKKQLSEKELASIKKTLETLRDSSLSLAEKDSQEFSKLMNSFKTDKNDPTRTSLLQEGYVSCAMVPLSLCETLIPALECAEKLLASGNSHLKSDVHIGLIGIRSASESCRFNIRANAPYIKDLSKRNEIEAAYEKARSKIEQGVEKLLKA